jgi:hypothetical protein
MLADEITPAIDGIPAEKAAPLPARARGAESCPVLRVHERTGAYVREAVKAAEENTALIKRGSVQEVEEGGAGGAPLREQDKVLVAVRSRAGLKANTIVGEATNQARASAELQEVPQRKYI